MKLNKKIQLGILFTFYLALSGKTTLAGAATALSASPGFLAQVARQLRLKGILKASRGITGGYELEGDPLVGEVLKALGLVCFLSQSDRVILKGPEGQVLRGWVDHMTLALAPLLNRKVRTLVHSQGSYYETCRRS